ncbi:MAG: YfiR family protein [Bacteroidota bacterium]
MRRTIFFVFGCFFIFQTHGQNYQLHSVYIYSFIKYVEWPNTDKSEFVIGVYGESPVSDHLQKMAETKKAGNKIIKIKNISDLAALSDLEMLFVPDAKADDFEAIKTKLEGSNTLIITESAGLGEVGSTINFIETSGTLRFELNRAAMQKQNLKVSSELTALAILI